MSTQPSTLTRGQSARERRKALGLSQVRLATEAGMEPSAISRYERDTGTLSATERQILDALSRLEAKARAER